jgi:hypothetical protein
MRATPNGDLAATVGAPERWSMTGGLQARAISVSTCAEQQPSAARFRVCCRRGARSRTMIKKPSRLQLGDITATRKRLGAREISEARLKLVSAAGDVDGGATVTAIKNGDTD